MDSTEGDNKKRKHAGEEEEGSDSDAVMEEDSDSDSDPYDAAAEQRDEDYIRNFWFDEEWLDTEEQRIAYRQYIKELHQTQGYRIKTVFPGVVASVIKPLNLKDQENKVIETLRERVHKAIKRRKPGLEFVDLSYACVGSEGGIVYYITFTARDPSSPEELKTYQFKYHHRTGKVTGFKLAPQEHPEGVPEVLP
ncbi:hypothetical protein Tsubulata_018451 [Turnera subulata]|uniref:Cystatin domain-containing protein n=1 Tax=Turnera subulata TaxID=218843 RepID=A0A9Q0GA16_9ROSI|nr:hypothetical protein Tsubulata_018451 [Turnera subulata]